MWHLVFCMSKVLKLPLLWLASSRVREREARRVLVAHSGAAARTHAERFHASPVGASFCAAHKEERQIPPWDARIENRRSLAPLSSLFVGRTWWCGDWGRGSRNGGRHPAAVKSRRAGRICGGGRSPGGSRIESRVRRARK